MSKAERLEHANALIAVISRHGRRFFYSATSGATGRLELDGRGRVWWIGEYRGARVYVAHSGRWRPCTTTSSAAHYYARTRSQHLA